MQVKNKFERRGAFTIVELLTVMSVIIILISLLVPALNEVKRISKKVVQKKQFASIDVALEMYEAEHGEYPDSGAKDSEDTPVFYCGAMKLAEAMVGQDQLGFHRNSLFRADLQDDSGHQLYLVPGGSLWPDTEQNLKMREGPYLPVEYANANRMGDDPGKEYLGIYEALEYKPFEWYQTVLCDVYTRRIQGVGIKAGMPILYYKANLSGKTNPRRYENGSTNSITKADTSTNIYNYEDNDELVRLGAPWSPDPLFEHPMAGNVKDDNPTDGLGTTETFYYRINNNEVPIDLGRPYKADSYILLSAGYDGEYGTGDDIYNFE
jgi:type II secretory pathway pseudopilin PulG